MKIIISPAKKMNVDDDSLGFVDLPVFIKESNIIKEWMQSLSFEEKTVVEDIKAFDRLGYRYSKEHSTATEYVFVKEKQI